MTLIAVPQATEALTFTSLASLANAGAACCAKVQRVQAGRDVAFQVAPKVAASGMSSSSSYSIWLAVTAATLGTSGWLGYGVDGTDKTVTVPAGTNLIYVDTIATPNNDVVVPSNVYYMSRISRRAPIKPPWWAVIVLNNTGQAFAAAGSSGLWFPTD